MHVNILGANKCEIFTNNGLYLQSFKSIVARKHFGDITLYPKWNFSKTTTKHVTQWLNKSSKDIKQAIEYGEIKVEEYEPEI